MEAERTCEFVVQVPNAVAYEIDQRQRPK